MGNSLSQSARMRGRKSSAAGRFFRIFSIIRGTQLFSWTNRAFSFKLNWMSGSETGPSAIEKILQNLDLASIQDERARECIRSLLNLVETLTVELRKAQAENRYLREKLHGRKGGGGKPDSSKGASPAASRSSEKQRAEPSEPKPDTKRGKLDRIAIDREEVLKLNRAALPPDAQFKGYQDVVVQELHIRTDNVRFRKEKYYAASTGKTYLAPLPQGYAGEFGPNLKSLCLLFAHLCNMTEPKIAGLLANVGILISDGQISNMLAGGQERLEPEREAIVEAGLSSGPWQHMDDTGTPVNGRNWHCHVLCNPLYTAYTTTVRKDRLTVIDVLRNRRKRIFRLNEEAFGLMRQFKVSQRVLEKLRQAPSGQEWSEAEFSQQLSDRGVAARGKILEAAAIGRASCRERVCHNV